MSGPPEEIPRSHSLLSLQSHKRRGSGIIRSQSIISHFSDILIHYCDSITLSQARSPVTTPVTVSWPRPLVMEVTEARPRPPSGAGRGQKASATSGTSRTETSLDQVSREGETLGGLTQIWWLCCCQIRWNSCNSATHDSNRSRSLSFVIPAFVLATTLMNLTFGQTFTMVYEKIHRFSHHHFSSAPISFQIAHILTGTSLIIIPHKNCMDENPTHPSFHFTSKYWLTWNIKLRHKHREKQIISIKPISNHKIHVSNFGQMLKA